MGWVVGGVALVMGVALVIGFILWPRMVRSTEYLRAYPVKPGKAWTLNLRDLSWTTAGGQASESEPNLISVFEAGPVWVVTTNYYEEGIIVGLDPQSGEVRWQTQLDRWPTCRGSGEYPTVLCLVGPDVATVKELVVLDAESGMERSRTRVELQVAGFEMVGKDALVSGREEDGTRRVARYASDGTQLWTADVNPGGGGAWYASGGGPKIQVLDDAVIFEAGLAEAAGTRALHDLWLFGSDGEVRWHGEGMVRGVDDGGRLLVQTYEGVTPTGVMMLTQGGKVLWRADGCRLPRPEPYDARIGPIVAFNMRNQLVELDPKDGHEKQLLLEARGDHDISNAMVVPAGKFFAVGIGDDVVAFDSTSGDELWRQRLDGSVNRVWTDGDRLIVADSGRMVGSSLVDGAEVWQYATVDATYPIVVGRSLVLNEWQRGTLARLES